MSNDQPNLDDVLNDYGASIETPNHGHLTEWIQRFPQYERDLTEYTVAWVQMQTMPAVADWLESDADRLVQSST